MKSVLLSVVRNEEDIIETFVRYHLQIFDHVSIISHSSKDGTNKILKNLQDEGLELSVSHSGEFYHNQGEIISNKALELRKKFKPQVFMALDADEFLVGDIRKAAYELESIGTTLAVSWRNYTITADDDEFEINPIKRITHRSLFVNSQQTKQLVPGPLFDMGCYYKEGCHHVCKNDEYIKWIPSKELKLAHFPIRSKKQFYKKALVSWLSKLANPNNKGNYPTWSHWKLFYDKAKKDQDIKIEELQSFSLGYSLDHQNVETSYVYDPLKFNDFELKYPCDDKYGIVEAISDAAEMFAMELGK